MAKTEFLQIRLSPADRSRIERAALAEHLDLSTWARQAILRRLEIWEQDHASTDKSTQPFAEKTPAAEK